MPQGYSGSSSAFDYDVVIVGAGISGIGFAYRLQQTNPNLSYVILESRHEIGGTWSLFKYPGMLGSAYWILLGVADPQILIQASDPTLTSTRSASRGSHGTRAWRLQEAI